MPAKHHKSVGLTGGQRDLFMLELFFREIGTVALAFCFDADNKLESEGRPE
jgi:hypothetical protein